MDIVSRALLMAGGVSGPPQGQAAYTSPGSYSWVCPPGVTSVCVVCVASGQRGVSEWYDSAGFGQTYSGFGGSLGWKNNISVTPGLSYAVYVGGPDSYPYHSYFGSLNLVSGRTPQDSPTYSGDGGGTGGWYGYGTYTGGGGAGGYTGSGGEGGSVTYPGSGGGGASGGSGGIGGGGVGIFGQGPSGVNAGQGGSGGSNGSSGSAHNGGTYGGGGGTAGQTYLVPYVIWGAGGGGAVRIIWGTGRSFPSTNTGDV